MCRYFAETSATLFTTILGQRALLDSEAQEFRDYWLSDGTYGSFRILVSGVPGATLCSSRYLMLSSMSAVEWVNDLGVSSGIFDKEKYLTSYCSSTAAGVTPWALHGPKAVQ